MNTFIEKVMVLQSAELFSEFPTKELSYLAEIATCLTLEADTILFKENDPSDILYILEKGTVDMIKSSEIIYKINKYEAIGTFGFFTREPRIFTAQCTKKCRFIVFNSTAFFDLLDQNSNLALCFLKYFLKSAVKK